MARWRKTIELKDLLTTDESPAAVRDTAAQFAERLKREPGLAHIASNFEGLAEDRRAPSATAFNAVLNDLYDWADANRVWIA